MLEGQGFESPRLQTSLRAAAESEVCPAGASAACGGGQPRRYELRLGKPSQNQPLMFHYVYILQSEADPNRHYIGVTTDLKIRLAKHNCGAVSHTSKFVPWKIATAIAFTDQTKAAAFERYLKSGSGRAFARRHL